MSPREADVDALFAACRAWTACSTPPGWSAPAPCAPRRPRRWPRSSPRRCAARLLLARGAAPARPAPGRMRRLLLGRLGAARAWRAHSATTPPPTPSSTPSPPPSARPAGPGRRSTSRRSPAGALAGPGLPAGRVTALTATAVRAPRRYGTPCDGHVRPGCRCRTRARAAGTGTRWKPCAPPAARQPSCWSPTWATRVPARNAPRPKPSTPYQTPTRAHVAPPALAAGADGTRRARTEETGRVRPATRPACRRPAALLAEALHASPDDIGDDDHSSASDWTRSPPSTSSGGWRGSWTAPCPPRCSSSTGRSANSPANSTPRTPPPPRIRGFRGATGERSGRRRRPLLPDPRPARLPHPGRAVPRGRRLRLRPPDRPRPPRPRPARPGARACSPPATRCCASGSARRRYGAHAGHPGAGHDRRHPRWYEVRDLPGCHPVEEELADLEEALCNRPFDLTAEAPVRAVLVRDRAARSAQLVLVVHHAAADGFSLNVLGEELWSLYTALAHGRSPELPPLTTPTSPTTPPP